MRIVRKVHLWLIYLLLVLVPVQILFAGLGAFGGGFDEHETLGYTAIHLTIVLLLLTAAIGRLGWRQFGLTVVLNVAFVVQMILVGIDTAWLAAFHALLGFAYWPFAYFLLLPHARAALAEDPDLIVDRDSALSRRGGGDHRGMDATAPIRVGTARWTIPLPQQKDRLARERGALANYALHLGASEINSSFYRHHRPSTYERWAQSTPADFRFSIKVPKAITHEARLDLSACMETLDRFLDEAGCLGDRAGPLLVQLPPSLEHDRSTAQRFFSELRSRWATGIACEPRHATWFEDDAEALLIECEVARVAADPAVAPGGDAPAGWPGLVYVRLHGSPRIYYSRYEIDYLRAWAKQLTELAAGPAQEVWCIFDNTARGEGMTNALELRALLD